MSPKARCDESRPGCGDRQERRGRLRPSVSGGRAGIWISAFSSLARPRKLPSRASAITGGGAPGSRESLNAPTLALSPARFAAHPDPQPAVAFDQRISPDPRRGRDAGLARHLDAGSRGVELKSVIAALYPVLDDAAHRKRQRSVATAIFQRRRPACRASIENHGFAEKDPAQRAVAELFRKRRRVPRVSKIHACLAAFPANATLESGFGKGA